MERKLNLPINVMSRHVIHCQLQELKEHLLPPGQKPPYYCLQVICSTVPSTQLSHTTRQFTMYATLLYNAKKLKDGELDEHILDSILINLIKISKAPELGLEPLQTALSSLIIDTKSGLCKDGVDKYWRKLVSFVEMVLHCYSVSPEIEKYLSGDAFTARIPMRCRRLRNPGKNNILNPTKQQKLTSELGPYVVVISPTSDGAYPSDLLFNQPDNAPITSPPLVAPVLPKEEVQDMPGTYDTATTRHIEAGTGAATYQISRTTQYIGEKIGCTTHQSKAGTGHTTHQSEAGTGRPAHQSEAGTGHPIRHISEAGTGAATYHISRTTQYVSRGTDRTTHQSEAETGTPTHHISEAGHTTHHISEAGRTTHHISEAGTGCSTHYLSEAGTGRSTHHISPAGTGRSTHHISPAGTGSSTHHISPAGTGSSTHHISPAGTGRSTHHISEAGTGCSTHYLSQAGTGRTTHYVSEARTDDATYHISEAGTGRSPYHVGEVGTGRSPYHVGEAGTGRSPYHVGEVRTSPHTHEIKVEDVATYRRGIFDKARASSSEMEWTSDESDYIAPAETVQGLPRPLFSIECGSFTTLFKQLPTKTYRKKWSEEEHACLVEGVRILGEGKWKEIKNMYREVLKDRDTVHLKDRFRNTEGKRGKRKEIMRSKEQEQETVGNT